MEPHRDLGGLGVVRAGRVENRLMLAVTLFERLRLLRRGDVREPL